MDGGSRRKIGGSGFGAVDNSIIDRMMLRFRPIAPKPPGSVDSPAGSKTLLVSVARKKRKYTRARKRSEIDKTKRSRSGGELRNDPPEKINSVATLQLLPETERTEPRETNLESRFLRDPNHLAIIAETVTEKWGPRVVESWVTVERVRDACMEAPVLGRTDVERLMVLERDTCPGFVSDGWDRIRWVNGAYRRLVAGDERESPEVTAWLVRKEKLLSHSFTCRVRLKYTWQGQEVKSNETRTLTAPCDVWKMDGGGLAWRLDINAALSLRLL